jgi:hypothetical protein
MKSTICKCKGTTGSEKEQRDVTFSQQHAALQVSLSHEQLAFGELNTLYY